MSSRARCAVILAIFGAVGVLARAQSAQRPPQFRAGVEYVEVEVRVIDGMGVPVRGLSQRDFRVVEDGVPQTLEAFSVVDLPSPSTSARRPTIGVKPDVATNGMTSLNGRTYLIVVDDASIAPRRTLVVRKLLRQFIERSVGPDDLVGMTTTGMDATYENFTNDRARLLAAIDRIAGQGGSPTVNDALDIANRSRRVEAGLPNTPNIPIASTTTAIAFNAQRQLTRLVQAMGAAEGGSKAIIFVSEGIPLEMVTNTEGLMLIGDAQRLSMAARRGNVPVYPVDPRGLSEGQEDTIEVGLTLSNGSSPDAGVREEVRRSQERLRVLADDSGGIPIVNNNSLAEGLDRVVSLSSLYYVLGYYSTNGRADGRYRRIVVTVDRPEARVLHRRGYTAAVIGRPADPALAGPPGSSVELRGALNAVLPEGGLPLAISAAAFRHKNDRASVAVVLEALGSALTWRNDALTAPVEMAAVALERRGVIKAGDSHRLQLSTPGDTAQRIQQFGFRWLGRLDDLKPGRYQIRAAVANGTASQGSVWYDVEIPDFTKNPLAMSDVVLVADIAMARPTVRPDRLLAAELPGPPTTLREFPEGANVVVYAEIYDNQLDRPHDLETSVVVANEHGEVAYRTVGTRTSSQVLESHGVVRMKAGIPLVNIRPGSYTLTVDARQTVNRAVSAGRAVPFQVVRATAK
ncbi:MAG TPA: VWA domain-containing protein [Vicinamibacterales bacterium]|nr:VWA domain-containing protein [Vicinamibacterales bacterium]